MGGGISFIVFFLIIVVKCGVEEIVKDDKLKVKKVIEKIINLDKDEFKKIGEDL